MTWGLAARMKLRKLICFVAIGVLTVPYFNSPAYSDSTPPSCIGEGLYQNLNVWRKIRLVAASFTNPDLQQKTKILDAKYSLDDLEGLSIDDLKSGDIILDQILVSLPDNTTKEKSSFTVVKIPCIWVFSLTEEGAKDIVLDSDLLKLVGSSEGIPDDVLNRIFVLSRNSGGFSKTVATPPVITWDSAKPIDFVALHPGIR